jgi:hypothetical protein
VSLTVETFDPGDGVWEYGKSDHDFSNEETMDMRGVFFNGSLPSLPGVNDVLVTMVGVLNATETQSCSGHCGGERSLWI